MTISVYCGPPLPADGVRGDDPHSPCIFASAKVIDCTLTASPDNGTVILMLADVYLWLGRRAEALDLYERARELATHYASLDGAARRS